MLALLLLLLWDFVVVARCWLVVVISRQPPRGTAAASSYYYVGAVFGWPRCFFCPRAAVYFLCRMSAPIDLRNGAALLKLARFPPRQPAAEFNNLLTPRLVLIIFFRHYSFSW